MSIDSENSYVIGIRKLLIDELKDYNGKPIRINLSNVSGVNGLESIIFKEHLDNDGKYVKVIALDKEILKKIDLSNVSFKDVSVAGYSFAGLTGVKINPQEVYGKNLSGCCFDGVVFTGGFDGCVISHANFKGSKGAYINPKGKDLTGCILSDVTFTSYPITDAIIDYADFEGSKGAHIVPSGKSYKGCKFKDATVEGNWVDCSLVECDFTGSKTKLFRIHRANISMSKLRDVVFDCILAANIFDSEIYGCDFTGSENAVIDLDSFKNKVAVNATFSGVRFDGSFDDWDIRGANFTGSENARIDLNSVANKDVSFTNLTDTYFGEVADDIITTGATCNGMNLDTYLTSKEKSSVYVKVKSIIDTAKNS